MNSLYRQFHGANCSLQRLAFFNKKYLFLGEQESKQEAENTVNVVPLTENINICNTR